MKTFITSDHHFGHANVIKYSKRPFKSIEEHDEALIANHNKVVKPGDLVYHLGDFSFLKCDDVFYFLERLKGNFIFIKGNHDYWIKEFRKDNRCYDRILEICDYKEIKFNKRKIVLCHYPMSSWNSSFHGSIMFHGHIHSTTNERDGCQLVRRYDVGVDNNEYFPVELNDELLNNIEYHGEFPPRDDILKHDRRGK